jgi:hypothetical protein
MLLHSLRAFCKAPGGAGSIWKYLEALARATGVSERFAYGFRTELHFADVLSVCCTRCMLYLVYAVLGECCTRYMLCLVYTVLCVCCTWRMLYSLSTHDHDIER